MSLTEPVKEEFGLIEPNSVLLHWNDVFDASVHLFAELKFVFF